MNPIRSLSITWRVRLLNGSLSALSLIVLIVVAQARIHAVLYGAVDRTLTEQAVDIAGRPGGGPRGRGESDFGGPRGGMGDFQGPHGGDEFRRPPAMERGLDQGRMGMSREVPHRQRLPGQEIRPGVPRPEPKPVRYGAISMMPIRHVPLDGNGGPEPWSLAGRNAVIRRDKDVRTETRSDGSRIRVVSYRYEKGPGPGEVVQTAALLEPTDATLKEIDTALYVLLLPLAIAAAVLGALLTEMALAPIRSLARVVGTIEPENLAARLPEPGGGDAFDRLAKLMNALLGRLDGAFARQKRFTASASHELRTPLAVIKSATSLLLENPESLSPLQHRALDRADQSADRANRLITDLLTLARTENRTLAGRIVAFHVGTVVHEAVSEVRTTFPNPSVPVICAIPEDLILRSDPDHFRRLIQNLVSNAMRYTRQGQVTVSAIVDGGIFELNVHDTGEGIAPESLARLGEPFYRPDSARAREHGGAGLGLSICKGIVTDFNGNMKIQSVLGRGTTVTISMPHNA